MFRSSLFVALVSLTLFVYAPALGQAAGGGGNSAPPPSSIGNPDKVSNPYDSETQRRLQNLIQLKGADQQRKGTPEEQAQLKAAEMQEAAGVAKELQLSCDVTDLSLISAGKVKDIETKTYEIACANGMGYFVVSQAPNASTGFSCFAAEGQREVMEAKGQKFDDTCKLPANADIKAMATKVLAGTGTKCTVAKLRWFGQSNATKKDYTEVACDDGRGYLLVTSMPGSPAHIGAVDCVDAATHGLKCALTTPPPPPQTDSDKPTVEMFKQALAKHNVTCNFTNLHLIGRETVQKRHVVEFACPEHPKGLVAFIPLGDNSTPFEAVDCATAAKRGIKCTLNAAN